jgi:hypothetical protein
MIKSNATPSPDPDWTAPLDVDRTDAGTAIALAENAADIDADLGESNWLNTCDACCMRRGVGDCAACATGTAVCSGAAADGCVGDGSSLTEGVKTVERAEGGAEPVEWLFAAAQVPEKAGCRIQGCLRMPSHAKRSSGSLQSNAEIKCLHSSETVYHCG